jgi:hypothetical protein
MSSRALRFLGIAVLATSAPFARAEATRSLRAHLAGVAGREFAVENLLGTMRVTVGSPDAVDVLVVATVHGADDQLASSVRLEEVRGDRGIPTLRVRYPATRRTLRYFDPDARHDDWPGFFSFGNSDGTRYDGRTYHVSARRGELLYADVEVRVPPRLAAATFLELAGRLDAEGLQGKLAFRVESADLRLSHLRGDVDVAGSSGDTRASDISGSWRSDFSSGDCEVSGLEGASATFRTSSGDVRARSVVAHRVSVETSSGDYSFQDADVQEIQTESSSGDLAIDSRGNRLERVRVESSSGDVRLTLPGDASFHAEADQSSGDMRVAFADGQRGYRREELVSFRRGTGGADIRVSTSSGDFTIEPR